MNATIIDTAAGPLGIAAVAGGLVLRALDLWIDSPVASARGARAFVSHAHVLLGRTPTDEPQEVFASPETVELSLALGAPSQAAHALGWGETVTLPIADAYGGGAAHLSTAPAGHVLGGAQLVVDHPRGRLVYAGDFCADDDPTRPPGAVVPCDELIVSSTFALPIFRFDPVGVTLDRIADWCAARLGEGVTPAVLAQNPGPAQAVIRALAARGLSVVATEDVAIACDAYARLGRPPGAVRMRGASDKDAVLVASAGARLADLRLSKRSAAAYASGWATLDAATTRKRVDAGFALADAADFDRLTDLVTRSGAKTIHATFGEGRVLAHELRRRGARADAIELGPVDVRGAS